MSDRLALIIANSEFDDPKLSQLRTPSRDAEALTEVLRDPAIGAFDDVDLLVNETGASVRQKIGRLYHRRKKDDLLLLYYSGHGIKDEYSGELYLATQDTVMDLASATAIGAAFVRGQIDKSNSRRNVVVLDCCHSGAFAEGKAALGSSAGTQEAFGSSGYGRAILTASNALQFAWQGDKLMGEAETSVFTYYLVEGLRTGAADLNGNGQISLEELYEYTHRQVVANSKQTPQKLMPTMEGQIIIARNPHPVVKSAELPRELREALQSTVVWTRLGAVSELGRLLQGSDEGLALAAREALERLVDDDSRRVSAAATQALGAVQADVPAKPPPMAPVIEKPEPKPVAKPELHPSLALKLSIKPQTVDVGEEVKGTVTLRNDGDDGLRHVTVRRGRTLLDDPFDLAAGKGRLLTFTTIYETKGKKSEKVTATGIASNGESVREEASATVQARSPHPVTPKPKPVRRRRTRTRPTPDVLTITTPIHLELVRVPAGEFLEG